MKKFLENDYEEVISVEDSQFNGAIGCCEYGALKSKRILEV
jgi:activator of 2-hydroxyglutaryl-CoA dehydratase